MKRILIIYTGGTIGMTYDDDKQALIPFDFGKIYDRIPELKKFECRIDFYAFKPLIDSSDMQPEKWSMLVKHIKKNYDNYGAFIILHGTDTMSYTASALSFMLENLGKPVILTGSQLPLEAVRTDARSNIITAVEIACKHCMNIIQLNEVCILFDNELYRGNRTEKFTSSKFDAFKSANYPLLAEAGVEIIFNEDAFIKRPKAKFIGHEKMDNHVALLKIFPGMRPQYVSAILGIDGLKGVVLESYGSGNAPTHDEFIVLLADATKRGITITNVSQCSGGAVDPGKYESSLPLAEAGVISGGDMTTESALAKMMFLFGQGYNKSRVEKYMRQNLRGELTPE